MLVVDSLMQHIPNLSEASIIIARPLHYNDFRNPVRTLRFPVISPPFNLTPRSLCYLALAYISCG